MQSLNYFNRYPKFLSFLKIVHHHLDKLDYDYPLIIVGDTGNGKSMLALHIYELYMKTLQKKPLNIRDISVDRFLWVQNFQNLSRADCNIFDEGATGLYSKDSMNKFAKTLEKLYQVFRKKNFFSIILIPDFFMITKFFRDHRARGLIWVNKRGEFKFYSKRSIKYINAFNENKVHKRLNCVRATFTGSFPDYRGVLREPYDSMAQASVTKILNEVVDEFDPNQTKKKESERDAIINRMSDKGRSHQYIADELGLSRSRISQIVANSNS